MLWKWWIIIRENIEFCALWRDHGYYSFTTRVSGKFFNQILLEVLMSCTKHFDLSSSLTLCCKIHDLLNVPIIFFWIGLLGAISR